MSKIVFLDRDGVICKNRPDYVKSWDEFDWIPGTLLALKRITDFGYLIIVVTNQSAVGRGLITKGELELIHQRMSSAIELCGGRIFKIYYCPHLPEDDCSCRKPKPDMLFRVKSGLKNIEWDRCWMVGDTPDDIEMGEKVGLNTILVETGLGKRAIRNKLSWPVKPDYICKDLLGAASLIGEKN